MARETLQSSNRENKRESELERKIERRREKNYKTTRPTMTQRKKRVKQHKKPEERQYDKRRRSRGLAAADKIKLSGNITRCFIRSRFVAVERMVTLLVEREFASVERRKQLN